MNHPALPPRVSRVWLAVAAATWFVASLLAPGPSPLDVDGGRFEGPVTLEGDVVDGRYGPWALGHIAPGPVLVELDDSGPVGRGDELSVIGTIDVSPGMASGRAYGAVLEVEKLEQIEPSGFLPHRAGQLIRDAVMSRLEPFDDGRALLAGFLIGDTGRISESDVDAMRRSGLSHFVAVSGSNVALFLGLLALVAGPLALGPRRRAVVGLLGLPIYAAATGFEPSVMRASLTAGAALVGRLVGMVLEAWQLLALAVTILVITDPALTGNVGFQLSVAATSGVLVGARWPVIGKVSRLLAVTMGAQIAVAPLLLIHFGSVPLLSPVVNLAATPLVAASTMIGAFGVAGVGFLTGPAASVADLVLILARGAASWPQVGAWGLAGLVLAVLGLRLIRRTRPAIVALASAMLVVALIVPTSRPLPAGAVVMDVGQGDAILIHGGDGTFALVDGGPEGSLLIEKLREYGVRSLQLVVLTHVHADHATGLASAVATYDVGEVWAATAPHSTPASRAFFDEVSRRSIPVITPSPGTTRRLGALELDVEAPLRRYASPNDQSIVITVTGPVRSMLLTGDIETYAQGELGDLRADVLKVPHQGAGTSDPGWLVAVDSDLAIISVGPNDFGHPVDWVVELLAETNEVRRTDEHGDILVDLTR